MKTSVLTATLLATALSGGALAAEVSIKGSINETGEASNNYFLVTKPSGTTAKSTSAATLDILAQTPTTSYLLDSHYSYYKYFGPGAADTNPVWGTPASSTFTVNHVTELDNFNFAASWNRSDAAVTQLTQSGIVSTHGSINNYNVNGGVVHDLGRNDVLSWSAAASTVSFTDPNQIPYKDVTSTILWAHTFSPTTSFTNSVNFDWFSQDNAADSQRLMWRFMSGVQSQLTQRLSVHGDIGIVFANAYENGNAAALPVVLVPASPDFPVPSTPFQQLVGAGHGWIGDIGLSYRLLKDTNVSFTASQAIIPLFTGQLQQSSSLSMSVSYDINQFSSLTFNTQYSQSSLPSQIGQTSATASDFFTAGLNYSYRLSREWRSNLSYTYRENVGQANSSSVLVSLTRDFTLMGNPAAINKAEADRGRQRARDSIGQVFPNFQ